MRYGESAFERRLEALHLLLWCRGAVKFRLHALMITQSDNPVYLKLQWAENRLRELDGMLSAFASHPQPIVIKRDPQTNHVLYCLAHDPIIDPAVSLLAGDVLQSLRSALDYLAWALVIANGQTPTNRTCFPITENAPVAPDDERSFARKVAGMKQNVIDLIRSTKPYKGGTPYLWHVHELNNRDKHRLLFTVGAYLANFGITQHVDATEPPLEDLERMARAYVSSQTWVDVRKATYPLKAGDVLLVDRPEAKLNDKAKFFIQVALDEQGVFEGEPLMAVIYQSFNAIARTIGLFRGMY